MPATLDQILTQTRATVAHRKAATTQAQLLAIANDLPPPRDFIASLTAKTRPTRIIAEVKRASPSAGLIRPEYAAQSFSPELIATEYHRAGANAISCLTDEPFFFGHLSYIARIKTSIPLPVLRKDFLIDHWQLAESKAAGADAVLLIAECLRGNSLSEMTDRAHQLGLATLIEVHDLTQAQRALAIVQRTPDRALLGVNNRNLSTMKVDLAQTARIAAMIPDRSVLVSESGIKSAADLAQLRTIGVEIVLVGEHLMRQSSPGDALRTLLEPPPTQ